MSIIKRIFLDLDGVVVDWLAATLKLCDITPDAELKERLINDYDTLDKLIGWPLLHKHITTGGPDFWSDLKFLPWGVGLVEYAITQVGVTNVAFLTSPGRFKHAPTGKFLWREKYYPEVDLVITKAKHLLANENALLIDDDDRQVSAFKDNGGEVFRWPSQYSLEKTGLDSTWLRLKQTIEK